MSAPQPTPETEGESPRIISPFAQTTSTVRRGSGSSSGSLALWIVSGLLVLVILGVSGYFLVQYLNNPYRTLEPFPMDKYLSDYRSMVGNKFKADLKVSASLDYEPNVGRLMVFTLPDDSRSIVVLIPPKLSSELYFTKGQSYQASLEVQQDGIVYADSCEKE